MISVSRLVCDSVSQGDALRYAPKDSFRPVVVWNCTRQCNLKCVHCYASAGSAISPAEMDTETGKSFIRDLADFGVPVILFSGGEPIMRNDFFELVGLAKDRGMRVALSTNGTLITPETAQKLNQIGFSEVGISLDGIGATNDHFRGTKGAFEAALAGIRNCVSRGIRVSLRLTITRFNYLEIPAIFSLLEEEHIDRACFYHLAYSGRGESLQSGDIDHSQTREVLDLIYDRTVDLYARGLRKEILTVANHADGIYLYHKVKEHDPQHADRILSLLRTNGGNNSGMRIGAVDDCGNVHPDQFWRNHSLGNVCQRKFSEIWTDTSEPLLFGLRNRKAVLKGRCARCSYLDCCNGNLRVRAEAVYNDVWAPDPACYLTDKEIGLAK